MNFRLLKIEFLRLKNYPIFWFFIVFIFVCFLLITNSALKTSFPFGNIETDKIHLFQFPRIWQTFSWIGSWFNHLWALFLIILVGNEINNKIFRQEEILGAKKEDIFSSKILLILILPLIMLIFIILFSLFFGIKNSISVSPIFIFHDIHFVVFYYIQAVSYMSLGFLIVVLFQYTSLSIVFYIGYLIFEAILRFLLNQGGIGGIIYFLPIESFSLLTPKPGIEMISKNNFPLLFSMLISIIYIIIFDYITLIIMRKRR